MKENSKEHSIAEAEYPRQEKLGSGLSPLLVWDSYFVEGGITVVH